VPKCKGGEVTIKLLKHHHAIQGVLQSEEYQHPCIYGWEANYLGGEMLELCKKWKSEQGRRRLATLTPEQRSETSRQRHARLTPEQRHIEGLNRWKNKNPEQRSEIALRGVETRRRRRDALTPEQRDEADTRRRAAISAGMKKSYADGTAPINTMTPEQRSERSRRARATQLANTTPEQRSAAARRAAATRAANRLP